MLIWSVQNHLGLQVWFLKLGHIITLHANLYSYMYIIHAYFSQVKCISGYEKGITGTLINIDEGDGVVKLDSDQSLKIIVLEQLAKLVSKQ